MTEKRTWITNSKINDIHSEIEIRQIYIWIITSDGKVAIVTKDNKAWQFPGGKPKEGETIQETIDREIREELGMDLQLFMATPKFFGYYLIENNEQGTFLQLRYILTTTKKSDTLVISPQENPIDPDPIIAAKFVDLESLPENIPWTKDLEEYREVLNKTAQGVS